MASFRWLILFIYYLSLNNLALGILDYCSWSFYWCHRTRIDQTLVYVCVCACVFREGVSPEGNVYSHFKLYYEETDAGAENQDSRCEWVSEWMSEQAIEWVSKREDLSPPLWSGVTLAPTDTQRCLEPYWWWSWGELPLPVVKLSFLFK